MAIFALSTPPRVGTTAEWAASTLVLGDGEVGFDTTLNTMKIGDGTNVWSALGGGETENVVAGGNSGTSKTISDAALGGGYTLTLTGNCTITFPTLAVGAKLRLRLAQDGTGSRTVTWPAAVHWAAATAPTLTTTASKVDVFEFYSFDGTVWIGRTVGLNYT